MRQSVSVDDALQNPFSIEATSEAVEVLKEVKAEMMLTFGIDEKEAVSRINRHWQGQQLLTDMQVANLCHDHRYAYLAKTVWYGRESFWWVKDESTLSPLPWP